MKKACANCTSIHGNFASALRCIMEDVNTNLSVRSTSLQEERRYLWSMLIDTEAWWFEFELLSHRSFVVRAIFQSTHSGECVLKDNSSVAAIAADIRRAFLVIKKKMKAVPAKRVSAL